METSSNKSKVLLTNQERKIDYTDKVILVKNISKSFKIYYDKAHTLKDRTLFKGRNRYEKKDVLKDVSFDIHRGEAVGLIGENGSGKSTTLKMLSRIMDPDQGEITIKGRVSSLLELGAGFHPDMTGLENIFINASILGLTKKEIQSRLDLITEFSELGEAVYNPVRTYSSGMYMRLAFSVAINVDADILLIDEILAVGDTNFQTKCFNKLREIKGKGTTIVIVSHSSAQIEQICDRCIWIDQGLVAADGIPMKVTNEYLSFMDEKRVEAIREEYSVSKEKKNEYLTSAAIIESVSLDPSDKIAADKIDLEARQAMMEEKEIYKKQDELIENQGDIEIVSVVLKNRDGQPSLTFSTGDVIEVHVVYKVHHPVENPIIGLAFFRNDNQIFYGINSFIDDLPIEKLDKDGFFVFRIEYAAFLEGSYYFNLDIQTMDGRSAASVHPGAEFYVHSSTQDIGLFRLQHKWII